jgi:HD-like signal output (HDOD) protein
LGLNQTILLMNKADLLIDQVDWLPPAPHILPRLLEMLCQEEATDAGPLVEVVSFDPALTARVLQVANSALVGRAKRVESLRDAVTHVGFQQVYQIVASVICGRFMRSALPAYGAKPGELWRRSVVGAVAGSVLSRTRKGDESLVFTASLLRDIGKLVLGIALETCPATRVYQKAGMSEESLLHLERALVGVDHAEVGGRLVERWNLPEAIVWAVRHHHQPGEAGPFESFALFVNAADLVARLLGPAAGAEEGGRWSKESIRALSIGELEFEAIVQETQRAVWESPLLDAA